MPNIGEEADARVERPEMYIAERSEIEVTIEKRVRSNKQKEAKRKRNLGQEYISMKTQKTASSRQMKARCKGDTCERQKKLCSTITDEQRQLIF